MKKVITKVLSLALVFIMMLVCLTGCGKEITPEKAMKEIEKVKVKIDDGFDFVEMTRFSYNSDGVKTGKEVYLLHEKDEKFYMAVYSIAIVESSGTADTKYVETETLEKEILLKKQENEEKYILIEHVKTTEGEEKSIKIDEVSKEEYDEKRVALYNIIFDKLLPQVETQLIADELKTGTLVTIIKFKSSDEIPQIELSINKITHKIHDAVVYFADGSRISYSFNYPMVGGTIAKTEIPTIV